MHHTSLNRSLCKTLPLKNSDTLLDMSPTSKDQIGDALLIVAIILMVVGAALVIFQSYKETGLYIGTSGAVLSIIGALIKRGTFDSWFTCSD